MKVLTIISSLLILQTSASFFDEIRGAVSTVEDSFGKLLNDVIYDVKDTIDCTLFAVEQVLSLGIFGDQSEYESKCKEATAPVEQPVLVVETQPTLPPIQEIFTQEPVPVLTSKENRQVGSSILDVDQVLCDVLNQDDAHSQLESVKYVLRNETERLTEISDLLRKLLEGLSNEVKEKFQAIELQTSEPSVESIWNDIKILNEIEQKHKDTAEATKISQILDQILDILDANVEDRTTEDENKIKEIMRKLSKQSKDGSGKLWKDADDYPKDFREYAKKVFDESRGSSSSEKSSDKPVSKTSEKEKPEADEEKQKPNKNEEKEKSKTSEKEKPEGDGKKQKPNKNDEEEKSKKNDEKEKSEEATTIKPKLKKRKLTTTTTEKPLTIEELAAQYGSLFDVTPDVDSSIDSAEYAKNIIEETKVNEMVMKSLDELDSNTDSQYLFL